MLRSRRFQTLCRTVVIFAILVGLSSIISAQSTKAPTRDLPLAFEKNSGQVPSTYQFLARRNGLDVFYLADGMDIFVPQTKTAMSRLRVRWIGANASTLLLGEQQLPSHTNYFRGADSSKWLRGIPNFGMIRYKQIYPGIDLLFHGAEDDLEHDFLVEAGADASQIRFRLNAPARVSSAGDLEIPFGSMTVRLNRPVAYQMLGAIRKEVEADFVLAKNGDVSFHLGDYDRTQALVIDPVLVFSTFLAGTGNDQISAVTTDAAGNIYVTGFTNSPDFPVVPGEPTATAGPQEFVLKLDPAGHTLLFTTFFGSLGSLTQTSAVAIAVDANLNVIVAGSSSGVFPHAGAVVSPTCQINSSCYFLFSLKPDGSTFNYSGLIGGTVGILDQTGDPLAVDASGNAYMAGETDDPNFQITPGGLGGTSPGFPINSTFVMKVDPTGKLVYSTIIPGTVPTVPGNFTVDLFSPAGIVVDAAGEVTIAGSAGLGLPTTPGVLQGTLPTSTSMESGLAGYILQLNAAATSLNYATYIPGTDSASNLAVDSQGNSYVIGSTSQTNLPVSANAYQKTLFLGPPCSCSSGFIMKIDGQGKSALAATYLGVAGTELSGVALDSKSNVFLSGSAPAGFPLVNPLVSQFLSPVEFTSVAVLAQMSPDLSSLLFGSYLSSPSTGNSAFVTGAVMGPQDKPIVAGITNAADFPTTPGSFQPVLPTQPTQPISQPFPHGFITKLDLVTPAPSVCLNENFITFGSILVNTSISNKLTITNCGNAPLSFSSITPSLPVISVTQNCGSISPGSSCDMQVTFTPIDTSFSSGIITLVDNAAASRQIVTFTGQGGLPIISFPPTVTVSDLLVGTQGQSSFNIVNRGNGNLIITGLTVTGDYSINNGCTAPLPPAVPHSTPPFPFCTIGITFAPTQPGLRTGTITITDNSAGSPHVIQLSGNGLTAYPVPSITGIPGVAMDVSPKQIQITGTNFFPASQVIVNGAPRTTHYINEQSLTADLVSADLAQIGEITVTVTNSLPSGGVSNSFIVAIYSALRNINILQTAFDPHSGLLFASVWTQSPTNPNKVLVIDPSTLQILHAWSVGNGPDQLALSGDGQFLYVGLDGDNTVAQVSLPSGTVVFTVGLGVDSSFQTPRFAGALSVLPGNPHSWVIMYCSVSPAFNPCTSVDDIAVFDNAVQRPTHIPGDNGGPNSPLFIGANTSTLYAATLNILPQSFFKFSINTAGISLALVFGIVGPQSGGGYLDTDGTLIYVSSGQILTPSPLAVTGQFQGVPPLIPAFKVDAPASRVYFVGTNETDFPGGSFTFFGLVIDAFDLVSKQLKGQIQLNESPNVRPFAMYRWGNNGLVTASQIEILSVRSSLAGNSTAAPQLAVFGWAPFTVQGGGVNLPLTITGAGFATGDTITAGGTTLPVTTITANQLTTTIPAALLATAGNLLITITSPANATASLTLVITPPPPPSAQISTSALTFTSQIANTPSASQSVTVSNMGAGPLVVSGISATGDFSQTNTCTSVPPNGTCAVSVIFTPTAAGSRSGVLTIHDNDAAQSQTVTLNGTGLDFAPSGPASPVTISAGQPANFTVNVAPGVGGFPNPITFSVSGLPALSAASFSPSSITPNSTTTSTTLTITTTARSASTPSTRRTPRQTLPRNWAPLMRWTSLILSVLLCIIALLRWTSVRGLHRTPCRGNLIPIGALLIFASLIAGCGGSANPPPPVVTGTPAGTYIISVSATSGSDVRTTNVTLIVQ